MSIYLKEADKKMKALSMTPPIFVEPLEGNSVIKAIMYGHDGLRMELSGEFYFNDQGYMSNDEEPHYIFITRDEEDPSIVRVELHSDSEFQPLDCLFFYENESYMLFDTNRAEFYIEEFPEIIQSRTYYAGIINLFPIIQEENRYEPIKDGMSKYTDLCIFLNPFDLQLHRICTIRTTIRSKFDLEAHANRVAAQKSMIRQRNTLFLSKGNIAINKSNTGNDSIYLIDKIEDTVIHLRKIDPVNEECTEVMKTWQDVLNWNSEFISGDRPIFKRTLENKVEILLSPYGVEDEEKNAVLIEVAEYLDHMFVLDDLLIDLDYEKIQELHEKISNGQRVDRKRNRTLVSLKTVYDEFIKFFDRYPIDFMERMLNVEEDDFVYIYDINRGKIGYIEPRFLMNRFAKLKRLAESFKLI